MRETEDGRSAEVWVAAQHRRTEDLTEWLGRFSVKRNEKPRAIEVVRPHKPRAALVRSLRIAVVAFAAVASVSAAVRSGKTPHVVLKPTSPMPAVNAP